MGAPDLEDDQFHYDQLDEWHCPLCFKVIDPRRPPEFNRDNCCCKELGPETHQSTQYTQQEKLALDHSVSQLARISLGNRAESCASDESIKTPEGPERQVPIGNDNTRAYLHLAPELGHNEKQHRRSLNSWDSFTLSQYFVETPPSFVDASSTSAPSGFLHQGIHIQSQVSNRATKGTKASQYSEQSFISDMSGSLHALGGDLTMHAGAWATPDEEDYPPYMSDSIIFGSDPGFLS